MPRRALRKPDPALDLSFHLKTIDDMPNPWDQTKLFPEELPLEVEVGSGKGLFLNSAAGKNPSHNFLGVEIAAKYARSSAAKLAKSGHKNAIMLSGDGQRLFKEFLPKESLVAVHVYFPDPWWKKRHHKRRVMNDTFVGEIYRVLKPGGSLHFWTDVHERYEEILAILAAHTPFVGPLEVPERQPEHDLDYRTHFERRMRLTDHPIYRAEFQKK